jgi:hypothetical protein
MAGAFKIPSTNKNPPILNPDEVIQSYGTRNDQRADAIVNAGIACNRKPTPEIDRMVLKTIAKTEPDTINHEVLIGSISVNQRVMWWYLKTSRLRMWITRIVLRINQRNLI